MYDIYKNIREKAEKDLREVMDKQTLTPAEWSTVKTILSSMCKIDELMSSEDDRISGRRGRSVRTGRYMSMGDRYYDGVSGHSITDRMIDQIERMYDTARTDHERKELDMWIDRIRNGD